VKEPLYWSAAPTWDNHPVCGVSWYEAEAYARFVGKRLPTEAEWEKAASWDAIAGRRQTYPWGEAEPQTQRCNHDNAAGQTTPVNAYPGGQSVYGCYDMLGNVWEWTSSWFDGYEGFVSYPYQGYSQAYFDGQHRVLKGASWATRLWAMRSSFRNWYYPCVRQILAGFRCASDSEKVVTP
jgi:formylglycine-generating enzyme required for sulfatase activity